MDCYGCDISKNAINAAQNANDGVKYGLSEEKKILFDDCFFDVAVCHHTLAHLSAKERKVAAGEIKRILKKNGKVKVVKEFGYADFRNRLS